MQILSSFTLVPSRISSAGQQSKHLAVASRSTCPLHLPWSACVNGWKAPAGSVLAASVLPGPPGAGWVCLLSGWIRPSLTAQCWGPDCYTGTVWRWAMALQFISCCSSATKAPSAHFSSVGALRKMDWLAGPSEEAKRVAKSLCSTWLLSYASLMKDIHKQSLGSFLCIRCLKVAYTLVQAKVWKRHTLAWAIHHLSFILWCTLNTTFNVGFL